MYLDFWGLNKHPFNNIPDPEMYFDSHRSVDQAVSEMLLAIEEGTETLAVVVGPQGVGKTMSLRIVLDSLDHEKYRNVFITNPAMTFSQLLCEIVGQLQGTACEEHDEETLTDLLGEKIQEAEGRSKRAVVFIDQGREIRPEDVDNLRKLTDIQQTLENQFTIVVAGQQELGEQLEAPGRQELFGRVGVYCKIDGFDSLETMKEYVEHRLTTAGHTGGDIFTDAAYEALWAASEGGVPRIVNRLCKLSLRSAQTGRRTDIDEKVIEEVARSPEGQFGVDPEE